MEQKLGSCYYCHQQRYVMAEDHWTQGQIDRQATWDCDCDEAREIRERRNSIDVVKNYIDESMGEMHPDIRNGIKSLLDPVAAGRIKKVSLRIDDITTVVISVKRNRLTCVRTIKDDLTIDEMGGH